MKITIELSLLTELTSRNKNYDAICDIFGIPEDYRAESHVANQIRERINTYYAKAQILDHKDKRNTGAAFTPPSPVPMSDPIDDDFPQVSINDAPIGEVRGEKG